MSNLRYISAILTVTIICMAVILPNEEEIEEKSYGYKTLETLLQQNLISARVKSMGGHSGNCILFDLKNISNLPLKVKIEPGRRLCSMDTGLQDILMVKERKLIIPPYASRQCMGYGFCCQARNSNPTSGADYTIGYMSPEPWRILTDSLNAFKDISDNAMQHAIWVMSDSHQVANIHHEDIDKVEMLRKLVAGLSGQEIPWYSIMYNQEMEDTTMVFSDEPIAISGKLSFHIPHRTMVSIVAIHEGNGTMKEIAPRVDRFQGEYEYSFETNVKEWPRGKYEVRLVDDAQSKWLGDFEI